MCRSDTERSKLSQCGGKERTTNCSLCWGACVSRKEIRDAMEEQNALAAMVKENERTYLAQGTYKHSQRISGPYFGNTNAHQSPRSRMVLLLAYKP